jgi:hypothetical protein
MLITALSLLAEGRGSNPGGAGGVAIVLGIAAVVALTAAAGLWVVARRRGRS